MVITVISGESSKKIYSDKPVRLDRALADSGILLPQPCSGKGKCGKCALRAGGCLSAPDSEEKKALAGRLEDGYRLACRCYAQGDAEIEYTPCEVSGLTGAENSVMPKVSEKRGGYAACADIGTTTVAVQIFSLSEGKTVYSACELNAQSPYGADVISRMEFALSGSAEVLHHAVTAQVHRLISAFPGKTDTVVITGNTAMLHFYCSEDTRGMSAYPFSPATLFGESRDGVYFPPCVGPFVGADITCAVLASSMIEKKEPSLLIDMGTNGETVYFDGSVLSCCSTAAGPAFEGAGISMGMTASPGAIESVRVVDGKIEYTVIGGERAVGLAGSGLIDAVACMLETGVIDETGYLENPYYIGDSGVSLTPADIRAVQLAKAAIRAGLDVICPEPGKIEAFYIAGGFGSKLNLASCVRIGIFPSSFAEKAVILGNAALRGALIAAVDPLSRGKLSDIASRARDFNLADTPGFGEKYIDNMYFN